MLVIVIMKWTATYGLFCWVLYRYTPGTRYCSAMLMQVVLSCHVVDHQIWGVLSATRNYHMIQTGNMWKARWLFIHVPYCIVLYVLPLLPEKIEAFVKKVCCSKLCLKCCFSSTVCFPAKFPTSHFAPNDSLRNFKMFILMQTRGHIADDM